MPSDRNGPSLQLRLTILISVVACLFAALFVRLWFLQVINAPSAQAVAASNGVELIYTPAPRGEILDRNGNVLVGNVDEPTISVSQEVAAANPEMVERLATLLDMTVTQLDAKINNDQYSPYEPVPVAIGSTTNSLVDQTLQIEENQALYPGVTATHTVEPDYTAMGIAAANIVGYTEDISSSELAKLKDKGYREGDQIGVMGIEAQYESVLRGTPGVTKVQVNSAGQVLGVISSTPPKPGLDIKLSIDGKVQEAAVNAVQQGLEAARLSTHNGVPFPAPAGSAVVEDPQNGTLLALATYPDYNPTWFIGGLSQAQSAALKAPSANDPLLDRATQGQYAPGSTFKLVTATAGLKYGLITPYFVYDDTGSITIGGQPFTDDNGEALGPVDLETALEESSDNYFNEIGANLWEGYSNGAKYPEDALQDVAYQYGFGNYTGIDLPAGSPGAIPTPQTLKPWYTGYSAEMAIGQLLTVTPLQLANAYSTFANGGTRYVPSLVLDAQTATGKVVIDYPHTKSGTVSLSASDRSVLLQGFTDVVQNPQGTATGIFTGPLASKDIAGKTGTAQVTGKMSTSVFTSFAPATDAQYEVTAILEQAGYGSDIAGPVVRNIYDSLYNLPTSKISVLAEVGLQN